MSAPQVLIIGAGPTGLVLALWLTRLGVKLRIIDKTPEPGTTSRALAVQVRTLEFYRQLGIADDVIAGGVKIEAVNFWTKGSRAAQVPLGRLGEGLTPYPFVLVYPQDAHERLLIERLAELGVQVERRTELITFDETENDVRAVLKHGDGHEETCDVPVLAGCDGASSAVRQRLGIGFPGGTYEQLFYVADVEARGEAIDRQLHVDLEGADFVLVFPLKQRGCVRLVGIVRELDAGPPGDLSFEDVKGRAIANLKLRVEKVNWFSTYRVHHRVANRFRKGRLFLLGDAAHIHSPVGGQGMNTGIGDAVNLGWKLAAVLQGHASPGLLDSYQMERIRFARRLVATTDRIFTVVTRPGGIARVVRTRVAPRLMPWLFKRAVMRRFLFRTVSQIGVNYRESFLSAGAAGPIRGGDRLPWVETSDGQGNFAPLASLDWQVHVYGEPPHGLKEACAERMLPLHCFDWQPAMHTAGLRQGSVYLVRPDGYIALAGVDTAQVRTYLTEHALMPRPILPGQLL